jgi:hypothetical protein
MTKDEEVLVNRWRLILGRFAESHLPLAEELRETDEALAFLYDREYTAPQRGLRSDATEEEEEEESSDQTGPVFSPIWKPTPGSDEDWDEDSTEEGSATGSDNGSDAENSAAGSTEGGAEKGGTDATPPTDSNRTGGTGASQLTVPIWVARIKRLFPRQTVEVLQRQALEKYNLTKLLTDESVLRQLEPDFNLMKNILTFRDLIPKQVHALAYRIVEQVVRELQKRLESHVRQVFSGRKLPRTNAPYRIFRNFDFERTIRKNLKNYQPEYGTIVPERLYFNRNVRPYNPWHIVLLVDQSGSMLDSVIYTAVMASIFVRMPVLSVRLAVFDTSVVDLTDHLDDPVALLMKVQLGGGTDIGQALEYGKGLIVTPPRTIVVLVSDLYEGVNYQRMYSACRDIIEAGSRLFVLAALDYSATPTYDVNAAHHIARLGADVAALTPEKLAEWIGNIIS